jgi:SAM-dependent methyltransferase
MARDHSRRPGQERRTLEHDSRPPPAHDAGMANKPSDTWEVGSPYEQYVGRWSRQVAPLFLSWLTIAPGRRWLDVGCGTGALCAAIVEGCAPSSVTGIEPSEGFLKSAAQNLAGRAALKVGSATRIPLDDASVDVVVSGLVLNFVPDQPAAMREMARVATPGATIAAYVWDYAGKMELMRRFWDAVVELDPGAKQMDEGIRFPLCRPPSLEKLFADAGLRAVEVRAIDIPTPFADFDDYWTPFLGGQGPAPAYAMALDEAARKRLRERIRERMPVATNGAIALTARAWAVRGIA